MHLSYDAYWDVVEGAIKGHGFYATVFMISVKSVLLKIRVVRLLINNTAENPGFGKLVSYLSEQRNSH